MCSGGERIFLVLPVVVVSSCQSSSLIDEEQNVCPVPCLMDMDGQSGQIVANKLNERFRGCIMDCIINWIDCFIEVGRGGWESEGGVVAVDGLLVGQDNNKSANN